jgi:hypothetical protein
MIPKLIVCWPLEKLFFAQPDRRVAILAEDLNGVANLRGVVRRSANCRRAALRGSVPADELPLPGLIVSGEDQISAGYGS